MEPSAKVKKAFAKLKEEGAKLPKAKGRKAKTIRIPFVKRERINRLAVKETDDPLADTKVNQTSNPLAAYYAQKGKAPQYKLAKGFSEGQQKARAAFAAKAAARKGTGKAKPVLVRGPDGLTDKQRAARAAFAAKAAARKGTGKKADFEKKKLKRQGKLWGARALQNKDAQEEALDNLAYRYWAKDKRVPWSTIYGQEYKGKTLYQKSKFAKVKKAYFTSRWNE